MAVDDIRKNYFRRNVIKIKIKKFTYQKIKQPYKTKIYVSEKKIPIKKGDFANFLTDFTNIWYVL